MSSDSFSVVPVTLTGPLVRLEPLSMRHAPGLLEAASRTEVWTYLDEATPRTPKMIEALIREALDEQKAGLRVPFAILLQGEERAIGSISYIEISQRNRSVEIGWAWLSATRWEEGIGTEASRLLIYHAFERLNVVRVVFKTDVLNKRSQRTISSLGAIQEGTIRHHRILRSGRLRDSVLFSLTRNDWQAIQGDVTARIKPQP